MDFVEFGRHFYSVCVEFFMARKGVFLRCEFNFVRNDGVDGRW